MMGLTKGKIVGIIIIIIILISVGIIWSITNNPTVSEILVEPPNSYVESDDSGLIIKTNILVKGSATISDTGDLNILYDDETVYSQSVRIENSRTSTKVSWKDFVIGNDQYTIRMTYKGKSGEETFTLSKFNWAVCEKVAISTQVEPTQFTELNLNENPKLKVVLTFTDEDGNNLNADVKDLDISLSIQHENSAPNVIKQTIKPDDLKGNLYSYEYDYNTGGGNYTIAATVDNLHANSDSKYISVSSETFDDMINILPIAIVDIDEATSGSNTVSVRRNDDVHFDASRSRNDGQIEVYEWDFDYDDVNWVFTVDATGEKVDHQFTELGTYNIALRVKGNVFVIMDPTTQKLEREYNDNLNWEVEVRLI